MSAQDQMRAMLDQLMGTSRNGEANKYNYKFTDSIVCKSFLLACCPHEILSSTRMDLGDCPKVHDLALRADYEKASKTKDFFYDIDSMEHLQSFISDCDRRTEASKKRLAETQEELSAEVAAKANKVHDLAEQIGKKLAKAEQIGTEGSVEESMKLMEEVEDLRKKKAAAEQEYRNSMPASSYQQQKLRVCEVCSAYLGIHDNDRRLADHFGGKLHLGFIKIREKLEDLKATVESRREKRQEDREKQRNRRYNDEDLDAERDRSGRYNNYHSRGGDRRDRYRDEDRRHKRSRSKERRHRRSKSRDKNDKSRSSESREGRYGENRKPGPNPAHGSHYSDRDFVLDQLINPEQPEPRKRRSRSGEGSRGHKHTHSHTHSRSHERSRSQDRKSWSRSRDISKSRDAIEAGEV